MGWKYSIGHLLVAALTVVGFLGTLASVYRSCRFYEWRTEGGSQTAAGLFAFSYRYEQCIKYRDISDDFRVVGFDASTRAAQTAGVLASVLGAFGCLFVLFGSCLLSCCTAVSRSKWTRVVGGALIGAFVCQAFTFLFIVQLNKDGDCGSEETDCSLGIGGIYSLVASGCYLLSGIAVILWERAPTENQTSNELVQALQRSMHRLGITVRKQYRCRWQDIALLFASLLLFWFSLVVLLDCRFFTVSFQENTREYEAGLLHYYYYPDNVCASFDLGSRNSFTSATHAAQIFGMLAVVFSGLLMTLLWTMILLLEFPSATYKTLPVFAFLAGLCQPLTFLSNSERNDLFCPEDIEDQTCKLGPDAILAACATCFYILLIPPLLWYGKNNNNSIDDGSGSGSDVGGEDPEKDEAAPYSAQTTNAVHDEELVIESGKDP